MTKYKDLFRVKNAAGYTYNPTFTFPGNIPAEILIKPSEETPALSDMFRIMQGIRTDQYLTLAAEEGRVVVANPGCEPTYTASGTLSDRKITVKKLGVYGTWCKDDWTVVANQYANDPTWVADGNDGYELTAKLARFLVDMKLDAMRRDVFSLAFFANDTAPVGSFYYGNGMEGLMVKLYDGLSSYCVKRVGNDLPNQYNSVLTSGQALAALKALHTRCNNRLKAVPANQKVYIVTQSMYENLLESYEALTAGTSELQFKIIQDGVNQLSYRGIDLMPIPYLDTLLEDSANPWYNSLRHFAILTPKASSKFSNLVIGTENGADLNRLDVSYDKRLRQMYIQGDFRLGVQFIHCDYTAFYD